MGLIPAQTVAPRLTLEPPVRAAALAAGAPVPHQLFVGRQGIFTTAGGLHAYEYLYRAGHETAVTVDRWSAQAQDRATLRVLEATFTSCAFPAAQTLAFINFTRSFLVDDLSIPAVPARLVIEVVESVRVDAEVVAGVVRLKDAGFRIALDDFVGLDSQQALLPYADYVKIDFRDLDRCGDGLLELAAGYGATLVAERIECPDAWELCREQGFTLFQGNLMQPAQVIERPSVSAHAWRGLESVVPIQTTVDDVDLFGLDGIVEPRIAGL